MQIRKEDVGTVVVDTTPSNTDKGRLVTVLELGCLDRVRVQPLTDVVSYWVTEPWLQPLTDHAVPGFAHLDRVRWTRDGALYDGIVITAYLGSVQVMSGIRWFTFGDHVLADGHGIDELTKIEEDEL